MTTTPTISSELRQVLRRLRLGPILDTLPERLTLAQQQHLPYQDFLELVLVDEIARRDRTSATVRARAARLDAGMMLEAWDENSSVTFDRQLWAELATLRFVNDANNVIIMGPVGVGKTHLATALGHIACRRRMSVVAERADRLFKRLKAARLDGSHEAEVRKLIRVDLLLIDDFALQSLDATETADIYEVVVERHRRASTVITSNREPAEWIASMADTLLAQSAVDRLQSASYELVIEGESYRRRQRPRLGGQLVAGSATDAEPLAAEHDAQDTPPATPAKPDISRP
jgi:DNA replication protein DnaC